MCTVLNRIGGTPITSSPGIPHLLVPFTINNFSVYFTIRICITSNQPCAIVGSNPTKANTTLLLYYTRLDFVLTLLSISFPDSGFYLKTGKNHSSGEGLPSFLCTF